MKRFTFYFILINLFFSAFYLDSWQNANTTSRVLPVLSMVDLGTMKIDSFADKTIDKSFVNGHYYLDKAPLPTFIIVPFYATLKATGLLKQTADFDTYAKPVFLLGSFICGSIPFVIICLVFYLYASKYTDNKRGAILSMVFLYTSFIFIFSGTFFAHVLSSMFLLLSYILLKHQKKYFYSGLILGMAFLTEFPIAFIVPVWAIQIYLNEKKIKNVLMFSTGIFPLIISLLLYNYLIMGSPFDSSYGHLAHKEFVEAGKPLGFSFPSIQALWGLTVSPYRGLLIYCPLLLFSLILFLRKKKFREIQWATNYLGIITLGYFLLMSSYNVWWGGWSYGPRQLMPIAVLLLFESIIYVSKNEINKYVFFFFSFLFLLITWVVKSSVVYSVPTEIKNPFTNYFFQNLLNKEANPNNILTMLLDVKPWTAAFIWLILFVGLISYFVYKQQSKQNTIENE